MKKTLILLFFAFFISNTYSQNYKEALKKINDYLKNFDNGYYGYLEVKDGVLYDRFPSEKYWKVKISDLSNASVEEANRKVTVKCKSTQCVYSTYTDSYHDQISFSQSLDFETQVLIDLLNNFITAYNNNNDNDDGSTDVSTPTGSYSDALKKVNDYLKTFDNGYYGYLEIKDDYLYDRYKEEGKYCKVNIYDLAAASVAEANRKVTLKCKSTSDCVFSTYTDSYHDELPFSTTTDFNTSKLVDLLDNLLDAYKTKNPKRDNSAKLRKQQANETQNTLNTDDELTKAMYDGFMDGFNSGKSASKYSTALKNLNDYLKIFNSEVYNDVYVKEGKVYFSFNFDNDKYDSYISIDELTKNTTVLKLSDEVKIKCKNNSECFYSAYSEKNVDHFRFFSKTVSDLTKMQNLVTSFIDALK